MVQCIGTTKHAITRHHSRLRISTRHGLSETFMVSKLSFKVGIPRTRCVTSVHSLWCCKQASHVKMSAHDWASRSATSIASAFVAVMQSKRGDAETDASCIQHEVVLLPITCPAVLPAALPDDVLTSCVDTPSFDAFLVGLSGLC